jgi:molybdate transport system ATP-binding protein
LPETLPVLTLLDKGRLKAGQAVDWVVPGEGLALVASADIAAGDFNADVLEARALGEITLATLALADVPGARVRLVLSGAQGGALVAGARMGLRLDRDLVHVMPLRAA